MPTPHILVEGLVEFPGKELLQTRFPVAKNKMPPEELKLMEGTCTIWLVEYGQFMTTDQVCANPPHPEAIFGNSLELRHIVWRLGNFLEEKVVIALDEVVVIRSGVSQRDVPYIQRFHGEPMFSHASGKPYWRADALFLFIGATS